MSMSPLARTARALTGAGVATGVALASHVAAGAPMPTAAGVLVPLALSTAAWLQLSGRAASLWRLGTGVLLSQWLFHQLFSLGASGSSVTAAGDHALHGDVALTVVAPGHLGHGGGTMTAAHLAAAALTTAFLHRADSLYAALARAAAALGALVTPRVPSPPHARRRPATVVAQRPAPAHATRVASQPALVRGPPVAVS